ncbi:PREDICTED: uncharacterized protein LOC109114478 [Nelumbo nucifera]|uniref:Uncharacterized protein LOC109114478 n=2 Tax=Nelumbo nucifera TaxID=4432 RepID=A0A1U8Q248_NELNU|nr:PREDICTED: uncharacterized protein LOC109114478 [Nelumbo nucifera]DAD38620.1 TPA_asm: hypothetical protein HUJ06_012942 [Nelumbo nucifera]
MAMLGRLRLLCVGNNALLPSFSSANTKHQQHPVSNLGWSVNSSNLHYHYRPKQQIIPRVCLMPNPSNRGDDDSQQVEVGNETDRRPSRPHPEVYLNLGFCTEDTASAKDDIPSEMLDQWMRDSAQEIVRNIDQGPFLVHVFCSNKGRVLTTRLERVKAAADMWPLIKKRWANGGGESCSAPDGIILVKQLDDNNEEEDSGNTSTKTWGILIQGRGKDCTPACYILKTCRVLSSSSVGFCTHFCLVRAKCFGETAQVQLLKSWLLQHKHHC